MDQRKNNLMRGHVEAGISAARFHRGRGRMLLKSLGVPMAVIDRVIPVHNQTARPLSLMNDADLGVAV